MYELLKVSAYNKPEITPTVSAVQHDSARVVPFFLYDVDFSIVEKVRVVVRKPSGRRVVTDCSLAPRYMLMEHPYKINSPSYKPFFEYYKKEGDLYVRVLFENLTEGETYYRKTVTIVLVPLTSQALAECGTSIGQLQLDRSQEFGGGQLTGFKFFIKTEKNYIDHAVSKNERANINDLFDKLEKAIENLPAEEFSSQQMEDVWEGPLPEPNISNDWF